MKKVLQDIFSILNPKEGKQFVRLIVLDIAVSILDIAFLVALLYVVGFYTNSLQTTNNSFLGSAWLSQYPLLLISLFFVLFSLKNGFGFLVTRAQFRYVYAVASRIAATNLSAYLASAYAEFVTVNSAVHIRKISQQPVEFSHYVLRGVQQVISNALLVLLSVISIFLFSGTLFWLLLLLLLPAVTLAIFLTRKKLAAIRISGKSNREKTMQHLQEALSGFIEINMDQQQEFFLSRYSSFQEKFNASLAELQVVQSLPPRLMEVFAVFGLFILVAIRSFTENTNTVPVLLIGGFMAAAYKIIPGIVKIVNSREQVKTYQFTVDDLKNKPVTEKNNGTGSKNPVTGLACRDISFLYNDTLVLQRFSMNIKKGDLVGVSGISGVGKTTLVHLLLGFLEPSSGKILINDEMADQPARKAYWNKIAYARQQPFFIHESIQSNIVMGREYDKEKLERVLSVTGINQFISQYPDGIHTLLAEKGKNISGGQRQRIILARALYKEADLLILDEPFNELDRDASRGLLEYLRDFAGSGKMVLLVTHDPDSLSYCTKIISLDAK